MSAGAAGAPDTTSGASGFILEIGAIRMAVTSGEPDLPIRPTGTAARFVSAPGAADVNIEVGWGSPSHGAARDLLFDSGGGLWRLYDEQGGRRFVLTSPALGADPYQDALFDPFHTRGYVRLRKDVFASRVPLYPLDYPLDELLIVHLLSQGKGVEIHASGIATADGRGYLFAGQSGAGKTTLANLWRGERGVTILSDERLILRHEAGLIWMYGTPWHGQGRVRLHRVFLLRQSPENNVIHLAPGDAVARLFSCSFTPFHDPAGLAFSLGLLEEVATRCRCNELGFRPDRQVVDFVRSLG